MRIVSPELVKGKKVLLRYDIDVPLKKFPISNLQFHIKVGEDYRLKVGLQTLRLCLEYASQVILMGHIGRPEGKAVPELSVAPIYTWLAEHGFKEDLDSQKLRLLENLRFEKGEDEASLDFAKEILNLVQDDGVGVQDHRGVQDAEVGECVYVNEAFAAHHKAASTTVLPKLLPHAAGLHFAKEVDRLTQVRENPKRPLVAIIGGVKFEDKYPAIAGMAKFADSVLVGGLLPELIKQRQLTVPENVVLGELNEGSDDLSSASLGQFSEIIKSASQIIWAGPVGKDFGPSKDSGNKMIAQAILNSGARNLICGGDTLSILDGFNLLELFGFVSTGGGASLDLLVSGTLPTIEVLE